MEEMLKAIPVFLASMIKFILGPLGGFAARLHFLTTLIVTIAGMMTVVVVFTFFGEWIKRNVAFIRNRKKITVANSRFAGIWKKYGLVSIAFLTPLILTPIGGTLLAISSGNPREKILFYMFVSAVIWALIYTTIIYFVGKEVLPEFVK
jgi:hypothetical protein